MRVPALLVARASSAAGGCKLAAGVSIDALLVALALVGEHTVEALAMFALSNYATGYPNEDDRWVDCH